MADFAITKPTVGGSSGTWGTELNTILDVIQAHPGIKVVADADAKAAYVPLLGQVIMQADTGTLYKCTNATGPVWAEVSPAATADGTLTTKGDLLVYGSALSRLGVGTNGQVLTADSTQTLGVKWAASAASGGNIPEATMYAPAKNDFITQDIGASGVFTDITSPANGIRITGTITSSDVNDLIYLTNTISAGTAGWRATARIRMSLPLMSYVLGGLILRNSVDSKAVCFQLGGYTSMGFVKSIWTSDTVVTALTMMANTTLQDYWLRFHDDLTNRMYFVSLDGVYWQKILSESRTTHTTPNQVGLVLNPNFASYANVRGFETAMDIYSWQFESLSA